MEESTMSVCIPVKERDDDDIVLHIHLEREREKKEGVCLYEVPYIILQTTYVHGPY